MKDLVAELRASIAATLLLAVLCCGIYPVVVWAVGQGLFPGKANGSLVRGGREGRGLVAPRRRGSPARTISTPARRRRGRGTTPPVPGARTWGRRRKS